MRRTRIKGLATIPQRRKASEEVQSSSDANQEVYESQSPCDVGGDPATKELQSKVACFPTIAIEQVPKVKIEILENYQRNVNVSAVEIPDNNDENPRNINVGQWRRVKASPSVTKAKRTDLEKAAITCNSDANNKSDTKADNSSIEESCKNSKLSKLGITQLPVAQNDIAVTSENDEEVSRPPPPTSPTKSLNRARIKAIPCLGQRRPSFSIGSASESEDESKKNCNFKRIRNDSVCSSVSTLAQGSLDTSMATSTADASQSLQKKTEFNSVIQRKCRRTDQSRKLAEARREFHQKFRDQKPDRQKLTMLDLIFYNPTSSPMGQKRKRRGTDSESIANSDVEEIVDEPSEEKVADKKVNTELKQGEQSDEDDVPAPQITIGANGEIVVDKKSLYIVNKDVKRSREALKNSALINGDEFDTKYGVSSRPKRAKDWSKAETLRFYKALNTIGTDFSLMAELFPNRSRREIKMKFKKEERVNRALIDKAIMYPIQFDISELQMEMHSVELDKMKEQQLEKDKKSGREERRAIKEKTKLEREAKRNSEKMKKPETKNTELDPENTPIDIPCKRNLRRRLQQGVLGLLDSDGEEIDEASVHSEISTQSDYPPEISLASGQADEQTTENQVHDLEEQDVRNEDKQELSELEVNVEVKEGMPGDASLEGSIILATTHDEEGKDMYHVFSINEHGEKVPIDITSDILEVLVRNQKARDAIEEKGYGVQKSAIAESINEQQLLIQDGGHEEEKHSLAISDIMNDDCIILPFEIEVESQTLESSASVIATDN